MNKKLLLLLSLVFLLSSSICSFADTQEQYDKSITSIKTISTSSISGTTTKSTKTMYGYVYIVAHWTKNSDDEREIYKFTAYTDDPYMELQTLAENGLTSAKATFFDDTHKVYAYVSIKESEI